MDINLSGVPKELKSLPCWLTWKFEPKDGGKPEKRPNVPPGHWNDKKLYSYDDVLKEYDRCQRDDNKSRADGIGFAFLSSNNIVGIDIDGIPDNAIPDNIKTILTAGKSGYIERSVSKTGFHIIGTCSSKPLLIALLGNKKGIRAGKVELYAADRFFTMSGYTLYNSFGNIDKAIERAFEYITGKSILESITALYNVAETPVEAHTAPVCTDTIQTSDPDLKTQPGAIPQAILSDIDKEILAMPALSIDTTIKKMYASNPIIKDVLKNGHDAAPSDWTTTDKSKSTIDMKASGILCYWLYRYGVKEIVKVMEQSALYRDTKADDYLTRTVQAAYDAAEKFYPAVNFKKLSPDEKQKLSDWLQAKKGA